MKLFIDCEYNGYKGELISMALVDELGKTFYEVVHLPTSIDNWVHKNVVPHLNKKSISMEEFQAKLESFLSFYKDIHVISDWPEDIAYLMKAMVTGPGTRIDTPPFTCEVRRDIDGIGETPHNALSDALALRDDYNRTIMQRYLMS
ncbi:MAG: hypothetical protein IBX57_00410 [Gammaproteobacteria bacterium]|nr:hypothetical protein [Gammaproteobacteria bacterium]